MTSSSGKASWDRSIQTVLAATSAAVSSLPRIAAGLIPWVTTELCSKVMSMVPVLLRVKPVFFSSSDGVQVSAKKLGSTFCWSTSNAIAVSFCLTSEPAPSRKSLSSTVIRRLLNVASQLSIVSIVRRISWYVRMS